MKKQYYALPKGYLSYSQYMLWDSNPKRYAEQYFDGRKDDYSNAGQTYGKIVSDALENGGETGDIVTDSAMLLLPKYDTADVVFTTEFKKKGGKWLTVIAKPDTFDSVTHDFAEYKTGLSRYPWTQSRAQKHPQMIWYAVCIWLKYGTMLRKAKLVWIETDKEDGVILPTGLVKTFEVTFKPSDYKTFQAKMLKAAEEIEVAWASHVSKPWVNTF